MSIVSPVLALVAALLFAVSVTLQQDAARTAWLTVTPSRAVGLTPALARRPWLPVLGLLRRLVRSPAWLAGWALNVSGFIVHAVALHLGSITVIQAVLVSQLLFALLLAAAVHRRRPSARDWWGALAVWAGVVLLIVTRGTVPQTVPSRDRVLGSAVVAGACIVALLVAARGVGDRPQVRSALVAVGAGVSFCATAVFVVVGTDDLARRGVLAAALNWPVPCMVVSAVVGSLLVQDSFASGSLPTALTAMTIADPVVSCLAGFVLFDAVGPPGPGGLAGLALSGVLIAVGVLLLATSPTLHLDPVPVRGQFGRDADASAAV